MELIDGKKVAQDIRNELKEEIAAHQEKFNKSPGLVAILVGDDPASEIYVNMKNRACSEVGIVSRIEKRDLSISEKELLDLVEKYNTDENFHGVLVQLPLPDHIDENKVLEAVSPDKDVDGFHPINMGKLVVGKDTFFPSTPHGIFELLKRYNIETKGKHVVVVGRSNIVGKPIANMMVQKKEHANSIVTICHSAAKDLKKFTLDADILIAAIGRAKFITEDMVKDGVVVIDVGISRVKDDTAKKGYRVVGDVDFEKVSEKASYITPVPKGVGPMTIAMLLKNTYKAFKKLEKLNG